ncbi:MAG: hypothetical protein ABI083_09350 [Lapillicoccus sp.]
MHRPSRSGVSLTALALTLALTLLGALTVAPAAVAVQPPDPGPSAMLPSVVPASTTPQVDDGSVHRIAQVGGAMVVSGNFTSVGGQPRPSGVAAFSSTTGVLTAFNPRLNGAVDAVIPGPTGDTVYLGGAFTTANGVTRQQVALFNLSTGALDPTFDPTIGGGDVSDLVLRAGRLYLVGSFTTVGRLAHAGLATVNPTSGALDPFLNVQLSGHHNNSGSGAQGRVGARDADATTDGSTMVVTGNFRQANGLLRDQVLKLDLTGSSARISPWATSGFSSLCQPAAYDSNIRQVSMSPDGSYFVIAATGGVHGDPSPICDSVSRWRTASTSATSQPTWIAETGGDTIGSVAVTSTAVFIGGHQRWLNNPLGLDHPGPGAIGRAGLAALDPVTGLPFSWNPGRNPRGTGTFSILPTSTGVWFGYDTNYIGNKDYLRPKIAFFPYAGGSRVPPVTAPSLPGTVFLPGTARGAGGLRKAAFDGATSSGSTPARTAGPTPDFTTWRGAFDVDGLVSYFDATDQRLHSRTFDGTTWGAPFLVDPYHDPAWDLVQTGTPGTTYAGVFPSLYGSPSLAVTGLAYAAGHLYYTRAGDPRLYSRLFSTQSGAMSETTSVVPSSVSMATAKGMFISGGSLYVARTDSTMDRVTFTGSAVTGAATKVGTGVRWTSRGMFLLD